jgi:hypothetical protein
MIAGTLPPGPARDHPAQISAVRPGVFRLIFTTRSVELGLFLHQTYATPEPLTALA